MFQLVIQYRATSVYECPNQPARVVAKCAPAPAFSFIPNLFSHSHQIHQKGSEVEIFNNSISSDFSLQNPRFWNRRHGLGSSLAPSPNGIIDGALFGSIRDFKRKVLP